MKRCYLVSLIVVLILILNRPHQAAAQILIGPVAGFNYSWTAFYDTDLKKEYKVTPVPGFHAGVHAAFRVRKRFFLHTSVLYSTKGKIVEARDFLNRNEVRYNYIDIPMTYAVDFKGRIGQSREFKYAFGIGPVLSYWLGGKGTLENTDTYEFGDGIQSYRIRFNNDPVTAGYNDMAAPDANRVQFGLNFTANFEFQPAPRKTLLLSLRYDMGHTNLGRNRDGAYGVSISYAEPMKVRVQGVRVSVAYLLDTNIAERKKGKSTSRVKGGAVKKRRKR